MAVSVSGVFQSPSSRAHLTPLAIGRVDVCPTYWRLQESCRCLGNHCEPATLQMSCSRPETLFGEINGAFLEADFGKSAMLLVARHGREQFAGNTNIALRG